ncbi:MAG: hypothetical protein ACLR4B_18795 [Bacteroides fragilis]
MLIRFIQETEMKRNGSEDTRRANVRVISTCLLQKDCTNLKMKYPLI